MASAGIVAGTIGGFLRGHGFLRTAPRRVENLSLSGQTELGNRGGFPACFAALLRVPILQHILNRIAKQFAAAFEIQLLLDVLAMGLDCFHTDKKIVGNFANT